MPPRGAQGRRPVLRLLFSRSGDRLSREPPKPALKPLDVFDLQWVADPRDLPGRPPHRLCADELGHQDRPAARRHLAGREPKARMRGPCRARPSSGAPALVPGRHAHRVPRRRAADGSTQLFMYWVDSNVTAAISNFTESPSGLAWSPDGRWLAFTMPVPAEHKPLKVELPEPPKGANWADPPKLIDRMVFRVDGEGYLPNSFSQLFIIAADGGAARQLTRGDFDHDGHRRRLRADGKSVLITANRRADADYEPLDTEIYRVDLSDDSIHALTDRRGPDRAPGASRPTASTSPIWGSTTNGWAIRRRSCT